MTSCKEQEVARSLFHSKLKRACKSCKVMCCLECLDYPVVGLCVKCGVVEGENVRYSLESRCGARTKTGPCLSRGQWVSWLGRRTDTPRCYLHRPAGYQTDGTAGYLRPIMEVRCNGL